MEKIRTEPLKLKIIMVANRDGSVKEDFLKELQEAHPGMTGECIINPTVGKGLLLDWKDASEKILRTSKIVELVEKKEKKEKNALVIITENSIYDCEVIGEYKCD